MKPSELMIACVALCCTFANAQATTPNKSIATDEAGRPVIDGQGHNKNYNTPAIILKTVNQKAKASIAVNTNPTIPSSLTASDRLPDQWVAKIFGIGIGATGMMHIDINNDGVEEIIFASFVAGDGFGSAGSWSILGYNKYKKTWEITRQYHIPQNQITAILTFHDASNTPMLAMALVDDANKVTLAVQNLATKQTVSNISVNEQGAHINEILIGDADNDGNNELIAVTDSTSYFYAINDFSGKGSIAYGAPHAAIGNVDADADTEMVFSNGKVVSYKNASPTVEWSRKASFGNFVRLTNIDDDAADEIIAADAWYYVRALDADIKSVKWEHHADLDIDALRIADINNDNKDDIIYGDGQWGSIHALDNNGNEFWSIANPEHGVTDMAVLDANADGLKEIVWGAGYSSSGADYLYIHDLMSKKRLFASTPIDPPFRTVTFGDVDNDGEQEFITVTRLSGSGYSDGIIQVHNANNGLLKWQSKSGFLGGLTFVGALAAAVGDVDNDGQNELVVVGDKLYDGAIYIVDVKNRKLKKTFILDDGSPLYAVKIADVDGDGNNDIVAGGGKAHTGSPGTYAYVVNGATGAVKWHSHNLATSWDGVYGLEVADIDGNGNKDILVSLDNLYIFDGVTHINSTSFAENFTGITVKATAGIAGLEVVAGTKSGDLKILGNNLDTEKSTYPVCNAAIGAVEMLTDSKILFTCGDYLKLFDFDTEQVIWSSKSGIAAGLETDALAVAKVNSKLKVGLGATISRMKKYIPTTN